MRRFSNLQSLSSSVPPCLRGNTTTARRWPLLVWTAVLVVAMLLGRWTYLPRLGNAYDLDAYREWTAAIQDHGLANVFDRTNTDYVGYHYLLWVIGKGFDRSARETTIRDKELRLWLKSPGLAGDLAATVLIIGWAYALTARAGARLPSVPARRLAAAMRLTDAEMLALGAGVLWGMHPALVYTSAYWGQNDSLVTAFAVAAVWAALGRRPALAAALVAAGAVLKPQPLIVTPVLAWVVVMRSGWGGLVRAALAGAAVLAAGHLYFVLTGHLGELVTIYRNAVFTSERLSFSAYNLWWPVEWAIRPSAEDTALALGPVAVAWGTLSTALVLGLLAVTALGLTRRQDDAGALLACAYLIFGFFMVGAGVHERYALPALAFLLPALPLARRWVLPALALSLTLTVNVLMGLPVDRLYRQGEPVWLSMAVAAANVVLLVWMTWLMLRPQPSPSPQAALLGGGTESAQPDWRVGSGEYGRSEPIPGGPGPPADFLP